jgi:nicotinate-nucleotide adenylyltransferase
MGADNWTNITRWKEWDTLIRRYPILIYPRPGHEVVVPPEWGHIKKVDAPRLEVSSSFIRQAYEEGKDVRFFLPETIRPYFEQKEPV